jgi:nicotinate-nucleotide pyrophosphorylase (carboxylating)
VGVTELTAELSEQLAAAGLDPAEVVRVVRLALAEDLAGGADVTTAATIPAGTLGTADVVARSAGVVAGLSVAEVVFSLVGMGDGAASAVQRAAAAIARPDPPGSVVQGVSAVSSRAASAGTAVSVQVTQRVRDGDRVAAGEVLMTVRGPLAVILTAERTALNLLCHLSGVATLTRRWVDAVAGTEARIRDTRKTLPGLRALQKYAVRCGGGVNHRMSLSDGALIKDNHVAAAGSVTAALAAVTGRPGAARGPAGAADGRSAAVPVEVECDTLAQVAEAVAAGAELILLDNFSVDEMAEAVTLTAGRARLEASGGLRLTSAAGVAATGVDFLAVGALTHSAPALDIALDLVRAG